MIPTVLLLNKACFCARIQIPPHACRTLVVHQMGPEGISIPSDGRSTLAIPLFRIDGERRGIGEQGVTERAPNPTLALHHP